MIRRLRVMIVLGSVIGADGALAEENARAQPMLPLPAREARFIALTPRDLRMTMPVKPRQPEPDLPPIPISSGLEKLSNEQAQQILSLFTEGR